MRITFVLPFTDLTGGIRMTYEFAARLRARGHDVCVVVPRVPYWFRNPAGPLQDLRSWLGVFKHNLLHGPRQPGQPTPADVRMVPWISGRFLPAADVVVATAWPTARSVARLADRCGARCYLIQHREVDSGEPATVDATYRLPFFRIAGSQVTADQLRRTLGVEVQAVAPAGIDSTFWAAGARPAGERRGVLMNHIPGPRKGSADGLAALASVHRARPDVPIRLFGPRRTAEVPDFAEYTERPDDRALRDLYGSARVFLYPSRYEGFGLPPLEAMAAATPVVATRVGEVPNFCTDGESGILVEPGDVAAMARGVLAVLADPAQAARMGEAAARAAQRFDLANAALVFEAALSRATGNARRSDGTAA